VFAALLLRIVYCQFFHPLSKFPGPWWATSFSVVGAIISVKYKEPQFLTYLIKKYGSTYTPFPHDISYPRCTDICRMTCSLALHLLPAVQHHTSLLTG
jgi:hypothetical protein